MAFAKAKQMVEAYPDLDVPLHLRNAPTELMKSLNHGEGYRYAHDEPGAYAAGEVYLPEAIQGSEFYQPSDRGLEKKISEKLQYLRTCDQQSMNRRY